MAIFGVLSTESIVQADDKTRIDATQSFVTQDEAAITLVEIEPESGAGFVDVGLVARAWILDWSYSGTSRTVTTSVRITTDGAPITFTKDVEILTKTDDRLFSDDSDIIKYEPDIVKWTPDGRTSFLDMHRGTQFLILDHLNDIGVRDTDRARLDKADVVDLDEVRKWSTYWTLARIFESLSNAEDDVFIQKSQRYLGLANQAREKSVLRLDLNNDGVIDNGEQVQWQTRSLVRR